MIVVKLRIITIVTEPECGTSDKLLLLGCEDGVLRCIDVRNRDKVQL